MRGTVFQKLYVLYWGHVHLAGVLALAGLAIALACLPAIARSLRHRPRPAARCWDALYRVLVGAAIAQCAFYLAMPSFADYGEPVIPLLAGNVLQGAPIYSDWTAGRAIVGSNYGPLVFLAQLPVLLWHPTIRASKLVGIAFGLAGLLLTFVTVRRQAAAPREAWVSVALMVGLLSPELHYWFWNRPDSMLIALVAFAAWVFERARPAVALAALGVLAGIATNLKLYGAVLLLPLAIACLPMLRSRAHLFAAGAIGGGGLLVALALPFALGVTSLPAYLANLGLMPAQGFDAPAAFGSFCYGLTILALPALRLHLRDAGRVEWVYAAALAVCAAVVAVIAGKPGGGPPYMMPLIPLALHLSARLSRRPARAGRLPMIPEPLILCVVVLIGAPIWAYSWYEIGGQLTRYHAEVAKAADLRALFATFPDAQMGHNSGPAAEADEFHRVAKAFLGQVTRFDYVNYGDQLGAGVSPTIVEPLLEHCAVPAWIVSRQGGRMRGVGFFHRPMFDAGALALFDRTYELASQSAFYEVWRCRSSIAPAMSGDPGQMPRGAPGLRR